MHFSPENPYLLDRNPVVDPGRIPSMWGMGITPVSLLFALLFMPSWQHAYFVLTLLGLLPVRPSVHTG